MMDIDLWQTLTVTDLRKCMTVFITSALLVRVLFSWPHICLFVG